MISRKRILAFIYYPREMIHKPEVHRDEDYIQNMGTAIFYLALPASWKKETLEDGVCLLIWHYIR